MNKVFLIGRLTRDPELRYTGENNAVANFSIAVNRNYTNQAGEREADFINIIVWRKLAENVKNYLTKGSQVAIDGRIQTRTYEKDGKKNYITEVVADNVEFLDTKASRERQASVGPADVSPSDFAPSAGTDIKSDPFADFGSSIEISDDELPF